MAADTTSRPGVAATGAVLRWVLHQQRRSLLGWMVAVAVVAAMYASTYDLVAADEMAALIDNMPEAMVAALGYDQLGSPAGYLQATVYGLLGPALLLVFGIGHAARTVAGLEEEGALELELSAAISRRQVLAERYLALLVQLAVLALVVSAVVVALVVPQGADVPAEGLAAGGVGLLLVAAAHASVTFGLGAATGRRTLAVAGGAGLAVLGYVSDAIAALVDGGRWLELASPWSWYLGADPLVDGFDLPGLVALAALTLLAAVAAHITFVRRDLGA